MKLLLNPIFLLALSGYLINRFLFSWQPFGQYQIPYLNDVLCLPVVLTLVLWLQQNLFPGSYRGRLHAGQVLFAVLYVAVFFEGILPALAERYTRDYWDMLAYAAGGGVYYFFCNPKPPSNSE